jgi:competence protein ComEA
MDKRAHNQSIGVITVMIAITCVVAYYSLRTPQHQTLPPLTLKDSTPTAAVTTSPQPDAESESLTSASQPVQSATTANAQEIVVHVAGAVFRPDVYRLPAGSRVTDAIRAAGGPTQYADTNSINLAAPAQDGSKIYVPQYGDRAATEQAMPSGSNAVTPSSPVSEVNSQSPTIQAGAGTQTKEDSQASPSGKFKEPGQGAVNINTASAEELQRLPGVGPAIAQRIIEYRQTSGAFKSAEELKNVSGIGDKKYAKLAAFVTV